MGDEGKSATVEGEGDVGYVVGVVEDLAFLGGVKAFEEGDYACFSAAWG